MKVMVTSFKRSHACTATLSAPTLQQATIDPRLHGDLWTLTGMSGSASHGVTAPFSWVLCAQAFVCALQEPVSPVLCKFWRLYGGVDSDLLQEDLCHTQVYCAQSPCPCGSPVLTWTSTGDTQSSVSVFVGSLSPGAHKVCLNPLSISGRCGV